MKFDADRLSAALARGLATAYLVAGDEPLQSGEAAQAIRVRARADGVTDRTVLFPTRGFDWSELTTGGGNLSLFGERRLIEVRLATGRPDRHAAKALATFLERPPENDVLLVVSPRLEASAARGAWVKRIGDIGCIVQVWPVERPRLPQWLAMRMRETGLEPDREALELLADRVEGNLLAAHQEIEKLRLLHGPGPVDAEVIVSMVVDSARYDVFKLTEAALAGELGRALHVLDGLRGEGAEPVAILGTLAWQIRSVARIAHRIATGDAAEVAFRAERVWPRRQAAMRRALARLDIINLRSLLVRAAHADRVIKGRAAGRPWDELLALVAAFAGGGSGEPARARAAGF